jgi:uncharacterized protein YyaL (SSP411 family)
MTDTTTIRNQGNRLSRERSLYLRQHAHNPVDWFPWGEEALSLARAQDKPIFLSIGYSSCHWCHVMEHEVFEHDDVAAFLNEHFVCIKVDREERPDLDAVYMEAVQLLTGSGGWPMSVFLTPDLRPFYGGTYFPRDAFLYLTEKIVEAFHAHRTDVDAQAQELARLVSQIPTPSSTMPVAPDTLDAAVRQAASTFDSRWGGFRARMKFPTPVRWAFLLHYYRRFGDERVERMLRLTLDQMAAGGLRDHVGGGFHRYTVDATWLVPHFEKMLYDNAQLASLFLEASVALQHAPYRHVAQDTLDFLLREMADPKGGLYASFDADSGGHEGSYYVWTPAELTEALGEHDGRIMAALFDVTDAGNFEGSNVLTRRVPVSQVAESLGVDPSVVEHVAANAMQRLRAYRARRAAPGLDTKIVASWNGLAISALSNGYRVIGDDRYLRAAQHAADYLWNVHQHDGRLLRTSHDGVAQGDATLDDYAFVACAMLDLHQASGEIEALRRASTLIAQIEARFAHPPVGFMLTPVDGEAPLGRKLELLDSVEPSGNAAALHAMLRLSQLRGDVAMRGRVEQTLRSHADRLWKAGMEMSWWLDALLLFIGPSYEVVVAGDADDARTQALCRVVLEHAAPHVALVRVPAAGAGDDALAVVPPAAGKTAVEGAPTAYVCRFGTCKRPTADAAELREQISEGWTV